MKKLRLLIIGLCICATAGLQAQDKKIKIKVIKDVNGQKEVVEKEYTTMDELKSDPELSHLKMEFLSDGKFKIGPTEDGKVQVFIDNNTDFKSKHNVIFLNKEDLSNDFEFDTGGAIKVEKTEDGKISIIKDGQEIESIDINHLKGTKKESDDDKVFFFKVDGEKSDVKTMIKEISEQVTDEEIRKEFKVMVIMKKITIEDLEGDDELARQFDLTNNELELDEFSYFPNPNEGRFTLRFDGEAAPTEIKIMDLNGRMVYNEKLSAFDGHFDQEIDLSVAQSGIYLLQVLQGDRALNKKIVLE